jgi:undecaprenyl-diphosphatase
VLIECGFGPIHVPGFDNYEIGSQGTYRDGTHLRQGLSMNLFDTDIIHFLNQFAQRSRFVDDLSNSLSSNQTVVPIVAILWWAWFRDKGENKENRRIIVSSIFLCTAAIFIARLLAVTLPYRERPLHNSLLQFRLPFRESPDSLIRWSSFPSDHAVFLFCLATTVFFLSRKLGIVVYCYVLIICGVRVYLGIHYPTDILAGAVIGIGIACLILVEPLKEFLSAKPLLWSERTPSSFYPCMYLVTFLFGTMFDSLRTIASSAWRASHSFMHH